MEESRLRGCQACCLLVMRRRASRSIAQERLPGHGGDGSICKQQSQTLTSVEGGQKICCSVGCVQRFSATRPYALPRGFFSFFFSGKAAKPPTVVSSAPSPTQVGAKGEHFGLPVSCPYLASTFQRTNLPKPPGFIQTRPVRRRSLPWLFSPTDFAPRREVGQAW